MPFELSQRLLVQQLQPFDPKGPAKVVAFAPVPDCKVQYSDVCIDRSLHKHWNAFIDAELVSAPHLYCVCVFWWNRSCVKLFSLFGMYVHPKGVVGLPWGEGCFSHGSNCFAASMHLSREVMSSYPPDAQGPSIKMYLPPGSDFGTHFLSYTAFILGEDFLLHRCVHLNSDVVALQHFREDVLQYLVLDSSRLESSCRGMPQSISMTFSLAAPIATTAKNTTVNRQRGIFVI